MPRKVKSSRKLRKKSGSKNGLGFLIKRFLPFIAVAGIFFVLTSHITTNKASSTCANSKTCTSDLSLKIENNASGVFQGKKVYPPAIDLASKTPYSSVLGANTLTGEKHIYVDLSTQTLIAYQGTTQVFKTLVSSGRWNKTPVGNFHIWEKLVSTRMSGGEGEDAYDLPNVPYVMYFYHDFGLHGAYWHDNFGHTMSHGCVNLRTVDAKTLFDWADGPDGNTKGTAVSICDKITSDSQCIQENPVE